MGSNIFQHFLCSDVLRRDVINVTSLMLMAQGGAGQTLPAETMYRGNGAEVLWGSPGKGEGQVCWEAAEMDTEQKRLSQTCEGRTFSSCGVDEVSHFQNDGGWELGLIWWNNSLKVAIIQCEMSFILSRFVNRPNTPIKVKWSEVAQSCLTLCDPMDCSLPGSSVHGIFQARVLEWGAISFSRASSPGVHGPLAISSLNILEEKHSLRHQHNPTKLKYAF